MAPSPGNYTLLIKAEGYERNSSPFRFYDLPFQPERAKRFLIKTETLTGLG